MKVGPPALDKSTSSTNRGGLSVFYRLPRSFTPSGVHSSTSAWSFVAFAEAFDKQGEEAQQNAIFGWAQGSPESARYTAGARRKVLAEAGARLIFVPSQPAGTKSGESSKENKPSLEEWWAREDANLQPEGMSHLRWVRRLLSDGLSMPALHRSAQNKVKPLSASSSVAPCPNVSRPHRSSSVTQIVGRNAG